MALSKRFAVSCESTDLHMRRQMQDRPEVPLDATRSERSELRTGCGFYSEQEFSAKRARATAKKAGWIRYRESFKLWAGADDKSVITFDICPGCAPKIIPDHIPVRRPARPITAGALAEGLDAARGCSSVRTRKPHGVSAT